MNYMWALIQNGIVVNKVLASDSDPKDSAFTWIKCSSDVGPGWAYDGNSFSPPTPTSPPSVPLNQQYNQIEYGQMLVDQLSEMNNSRGLTSSQMFSMAQNFGTFFILLQTGALQTFLDNLALVPVDGIIITNDLVSFFTNAIQNYLRGS